MNKEIEELIYFWHSYSCYRHYSLLTEFNEFDIHPDYEGCVESYLKDFRDAKEGVYRNMNYLRAYKLLTDK